MPSFSSSTFSTNGSRRPVLSLRAAASVQCAHFAYYRDTTAIADDLRYLSRAREEG